MNHWILVPAYGRDYQTAEAVRADWEGGRDFKIVSCNSRWCGAYTSCRDEMPEGTYIRYKKLTQLTHIGRWEEAEEDEEAKATEATTVSARKQN